MCWRRRANCVGRTTDSFLPLLSCEKGPFHSIGGLAVLPRRKDGLSVKARILIRIVSSDRSPNPPPPEDLHSNRWPDILFCPFFGRIGGIHPAHLNRRAKSGAGILLSAQNAHGTLQERVNILADLVSIQLDGCKYQSVAMWCLSQDCTLIYHDPLLLVSLTTTTTSITSLTCQSIKANN